tara:strand:- start:24 stop:941 length:918 start_codon:yes stop_codon:yes gene_type:complete
MDLKFVNFSNTGWKTSRILLGYFLLSSNIAVEKWLLGTYSLYEINFITAGLFMALTILHELLNRGSLLRIKPISWKILLPISLYTVGAWHCFLSALEGLSVFEFGAMSLLFPVVMSVLAILILRENPTIWTWPAIGFGMAGGWLMIQADWYGLRSSHFHAYMLGALIFSSLRWITVKYAGDRVPAAAMIFWEPVLVLLTMLFFIDFTNLWNKITPILLFAGVLLFFSRQCLVRSYQNSDTSATTISTLIYTKLGWTLLFGYLFWGTLPNLLEWLGVILIIISSWIIVYNSNQSSINRNMIQSNNK